MPRVPSWLRMLALGVAGLVVAAALGVVAHLITRETISLSATTLQAGRPLAPPAAREVQRRVVPRPPPDPRQTAETAPRARTERDDEDNERERRTETRSENSGKGSSGDSDNSGSGSSDSGKGSRDD